METVNEANFAVYVAKITTMNKDQKVASERVELVTDSRVPPAPTSDSEFNSDESVLYNEKSYPLTQVVDKTEMGFFLYFFITLFQEHGIHVPNMLVQ